jgi:hypothetical protein
MNRKPDGPFHSQNGIKAKGEIPVAILIILEKTKNLTP